MTPIIELHRNVGKQSEVIGLAVLPLKVLLTDNIYGEWITFFYQSTKVNLWGLITPDPIGALQLTFAFGLERHKTLFETHFLVCEPPEPAPADAHSDRKHHHHHHHHHRHKRIWQPRAVALGWTPPDLVPQDWRRKARERGWRAPPNVDRRSLPTSCEYRAVVPCRESGSQVCRVLKTRETIGTQSSIHLDETCAIQHCGILIDLQRESYSSLSEIDPSLREFIPTRPVTSSSQSSTDTLSSRDSSRAERSSGSSDGAVWRAIHRLDPDIERYLSILHDQA
jgi:hypothetical protein